ncbi:MAG: hypothetical protein KF718_00930 [Polyangiaceae bacterium]|nr:hypothetical protein [Polyangiaceae bacterium]
MKAQLSTLCSLAALAMGCGATGVPTPQIADLDSPTAKQSARGADSFVPSDAIYSEDEPVAKGPTPFAQREVGDYVVHRFSGSFNKSPMVLTESVIAKRGALIIIDYTLEEGSRATRLRVTHDIDTDKVLRVREMQGNRELAATEAQYEALIAKTVFAPDSNDALVASEAGTCLIGQEEVDCEKVRYSVTVNEQAAELTVARSASLEGRDLSGEITTKDGKIVYKAELVERGKGMPSQGFARR